jgi:cell division protein FtsL
MRRALGWIASLAIIAAACLAFFYLSQSTGVAATGYEIDAVQQQIDHERQEQQQLILAIAQARAPARIEARATKGLALQPIPDAAVQFAQTRASTR